MHIRREKCNSLLRVWCVDPINAIYTPNSFIIRITIRNMLHAFPHPLIPFCILQSMRSEFSFDLSTWSFWSKNKQCQYVPTPHFKFRNNKKKCPKKLLSRENRHFDWMNFRLQRQPINNGYLWSRYMKRKKQKQKVSNALCCCCCRY